MNIIYVGTIVYLLGCYLGLENFVWTEWRAVIFGLVAFCLPGMVLIRRRLKFFYVLVTAFFFLLGLWFGLGGGYAKMELGSYFNAHVEFYGHIDPLSVRRNEFGNSCSVDCQSLIVEGKVVDFCGKIRIATKNILPDKGFLKIEGKLQELNIYRNPGVFDMDSWNRVQGYGGMVRKARVEDVTDSMDDGWQWWSEIKDRLALLNLRLRKEIVDVVPNEAGSVLSGMLLGGNMGLSEETRETFSANGLSHLLAVSGTHLMLLAGFLLAIFKSLKDVFGKSKENAAEKNFMDNCKAKRNENWQWINFLVLGILFLYAMLCGLRASVLRAWLMVAVVLLGGKDTDRGSVLCLAALVLLMFNPLLLLDVGFQLSFGAAAGLIWFLPKLQNYVSLYLSDICADVVAVTLAAQLSTLPFLIGYFHQVSFLSLPAGVLLLPLLEVGALFALVGVVFSLTIGFTLPLELGGVVVAQVLHWADLLAEIPWGVVTVALQPLWYAAVYYLFLIFLLNLDFVFSLSFTWRPWIMGGCGVVLIGKFLWNFFVPLPMTVYFLDVGQGDCAVAVTPKKQVVVIDTGGAYGFDIGSRILTPFLRSKGITEIDMMVLSHGDFDHAGGAAGLARNIPVKKIVLQRSDLTEAEQKLVDVSPQSELIYAQNGDEYNFDELNLKILAAPCDEVGNGSSVVCALEYEGNGILFTGDSDGVKEYGLQLPRTYNIVKVPHHGSQYSNSEEFYQEVKPEVAIISVGHGNSYGHPHKETLTRIDGCGAKILRTDEGGMISVILENGVYRCETFE